MDQYREYFDDRLKEYGCIYCGSLSKRTREHVPSKVFLDRPYPENLPVVDACEKCNNGFSTDEAYVACLLGILAVGSTEPTAMHREVVANLLSRSPALSARFDGARVIHNGAYTIFVESERLLNVITKLARGHVFFELGRSEKRKPSAVSWALRNTLSDAENREFDQPEIIGPIGEIGTRQTQRLQVLQLTLAGPDGERYVAGMVLNGWIDVQDGNYRYQVIETTTRVLVRLVIGELLSAEVAWDVDLRKGLS